MSNKFIECAQVILLMVVTFGGFAFLLYELALKF
jgi:hypothetical protein